MAVSSLPSKYGIGDFGTGAYEFIDMLKQSGAKNLADIAVKSIGIWKFAISAIFFTCDG